MLSMPNDNAGSIRKTTTIPHNTPGQDKATKARQGRASQAKKIPTTYVYVLYYIAVVQNGTIVHSCTSLHLPHAR